MSFAEIIQRSASKVWRGYRLEVIAFFLIFGIRLAYTLFVQLKFGSQAFTAFSDAEAYMLLAHNLLERGVFSIMEASPWIPDSLRTPMYPFLLAGFARLKIPITGFIVLQNILAGFIGVFLVRLGQLLFKNRAIGFIAAFLYAVEPASIYWNGLVMPDNGLVFLAVLALYLFIKKRWYWFAFALGIGTLARPTALYFFPVFIIFYFYLEHINRRTISRALAMAVIMLLAAAPWIARNKIIFDTYELSSAGWYNSQFIISRFAEEHNIPYSEPRMPSDFFSNGGEGIPRAGYIFSYDFRNVPFYKQQFMRIASEQPLAYALYHLQAMARSLSGHDYEYMVEYVVAEKLPQIGTRISSVFVRTGNVAWLLVYAFAVFGLFIREHREWKLFLLLLIIWNVFLVGFAGGSWGGRYNLPVAPMMFLLASYGMHAWYGMMKRFYVRDKRI